MGNIGDILAQKNFDEPKEIKIIKEYIWAHFQSDCHVTLREKDIVINVKSASLAGALRMKIYELRGICETEKRLTIRIGR